MTSFTNTWDASYEASPADTDLKSQGAGKIRGLKSDVQERGEVDHSWAGNADDGTHKKVTLVDPLGADPSTVADQGFLYTKNVSSVVELFWKDEAGNVIQLTGGGALVAGIVGEIRMWSTSSAPSGWAMCDGSSKDSVGDTTFAALFAVIGTTFGGVGASDFDMPDFDGRVPIGVGTSNVSDATAHALAETEGFETHTLLTAEMPTHTHTSPFVLTSNQLQGAGNSAPQPGTGPATGSTGGDGSHNNLQPSLGIYFIIKK